MHGRPPATLCNVSKDHASDLATGLAFGMHYRAPRNTINNIFSGRASCFD
jgi:hypothetical protein